MPAYDLYFQQWNGKIEHLCTIALLITLTNRNFHDLVLVVKYGKVKQIGIFFVKFRRNHKNYLHFQHKTWWLNSVLLNRNLTCCNNFAVSA